MQNGVKHEKENVCPKRGSFKRSQWGKSYRNQATPLPAHITFYPEVCGVVIWLPNTDNCLLDTYAHISEDCNLNRLIKQEGFRHIPEPPSWNLRQGTNYPKKFLIAFLTPSMQMPGHYY